IDPDGAACPGSIGGARIEGNFLGLAPDGSAAGNVSHAVLHGRAAARIGGILPAERNIISANGAGAAAAPLMSGDTDASNASGQSIDQVEAPAVLPNGAIVAIASDGTQILGNYFGTDPSGTAARENLIDAIILASDGIVVGGAAPNRIAFNRNGIAVVSGHGNTIQANEVFSNAQLGIDLSSSHALNGVTPNDA